MNNNKEYYQEHFFEVYEKRVIEEMPRLNIKSFSMTNLLGAFKEAFNPENIERFTTIFKMTKGILKTACNSIVRLDSKVEMLEKRLDELERGKNGDIIG